MKCYVRFHSGKRPSAARGLSTTRQEPDAQRQMCGGMPRDVTVQPESLQIPHPRKDLKFQSLLHYWRHSQRSNVIF